MRFSKAIGGAGWSVAGQVTPPAIWGKLPTHGDYLQHAVRADEVRGWQRWLGNALPAQHHKAATGKRPGRAHKWVLLEPGRYKPAPSSIPVAFVLPAGTVAFAPDQYVVGVIANSCDRLGREHPMLVYQRANRRWLNQCLAPAGKGAPSAPDQGDATHRLEQQNWLFWLARLVSRYVAEPEQASSLWTEDARDGSAAAVSDVRISSMMGLESAVAQLWALYAPGWSQWVGVPKPRPALAQLQQLIDSAAPARDFDAADNLRGVGHLPWADWPARLDGPQAQPAFWQQDAYGGYVGATQRLADLWGRRE